VITIALDMDLRTDAADGGGGVYRFTSPERTDGAGMELLQSRRREDGSWLLQGRAAKAGILTYQRGGRTVRELVEPEVLSDPDCLASLERCVVTLEHPTPIPTMITPANVGIFGVGDVGGDSAAPAVTWDAEGGYQVVSVCVRREDAIDAIQNGKHELSIGYRVTQLDTTPGVHPVYGPYDVRQLKRRNNHVAITDTARAGHGAALRVDSAGHLTSESPMHPQLLALLALLGLRTDNADAALAEAPAKIAEMKAAMPAEGASKLADLEKKVVDLTAALASATTDLAAAKAASEPDAVVAEIETAMDASTPADVAAAPPAEQRMDAIRTVVRRRADERSKLERIAADLRVDAAEVAKLGDVALRKKLVLTAFPQAKADGSNDYYTARLDSLIEGARVDAADAAAHPYAEMNRRAAESMAAAGAERTDAADPKAAKKAPSLSAMSLAHDRAALKGATA